MIKNKKYKHPECRNDWPDFWKRCREKTIYQDPGENWNDFVKRRNGKHLSKKKEEKEIDEIFNFVVSKTKRLRGDDPALRLGNAVIKVCVDNFPHRNAAAIVNAWVWSEILTKEAKVQLLAIKSLEGELNALSIQELFKEKVVVEKELIAGGLVTSAIVITKDGLKVLESIHKSLQPKEE